VSVVANVAINVDSRGAVSKLRQVQGQAQQTERAFGGIAAAATKLAVAFGGIQAARFVFVKTAELESQTRSLQVLTGSAEKAGQIIKELQQLGAVTPFTSTELIDSAKRLQAFGVEADKVVETTRRLADASGATGAELSGLVTAYGQVQAKGRLQGEELLQFQERGIGLQQELRKMYGMTGEEFQKALEKGQISAKAVEVALVNLTSVGGKYANGAIAQSDTLQGRLSTLQDGIDGLARGIGTALSPAIKAVLNEAIFAINLINQLIATGARAKSFGLGDSQRKQILNQAQTEAQQIVEGRRIKDPFERNRQFQELAGQRERDLIESYGYSTGQVKAKGGFVTGPTNAVIGEGGESEYVIPASKMNAAMSRYGRGARGEGVIAGNGTTSEGGAPAAAGPVAIDVRYSVERINNVEYVTASQFQEGMRQAAQQGAAQGEQRTLRRLQQSPSTRKRVGV
jgi:tape measure domain-containing protein